MALKCFSWSLPGIVFPLVLGSAFEWFPSKCATYRWFFIITGVMQAIMQFALIPLGWDHHVKKLPPPQRKQQSYDIQRVPMGARLCDRLFFGNLSLLAKELSSGISSDDRVKDSTK